jgi:hypothetical protein
MLLSFSGLKDEKPVSRDLSTGNASDDDLPFAIEPFVTGGFRLDIRESGNCHESVGRKRGFALE